jgi:hypothetical protein
MKGMKDESYNVAQELRNWSYLSFYLQRISPQISVSVDDKCTFKVAPSYSYPLAVLWGFGFTKFISYKRSFPDSPQKRKIQNKKNTAWVYNLFSNSNFTINDDKE